MFLFIGTQEIIIVLVVALLIFGPERIPEIAKNIGKGIRALRDTTTEVKNEIMKEVDETGIKKAIPEDVKKEAGELKKIMQIKEDINDFTKGVKGTIKRK